MAYLPVIQKEQEIQETRAKYDEALQPFNRSAPRPFPDEMNEQYRRRVLPILQTYAPGMQEVKAYDAYGTAFDLIEKQTFEAAQREAQTTNADSRWSNYAKLKGSIRAVRCLMSFTESPVCGWSISVLARNCSKASALQVNGVTRPRTLPTLLG